MGMNLKNIKIGLQDYEQNEVDAFIQHVKEAEAETKRDGSIKNPWFREVLEADLIRLYKKVYMGGVYIDGKSVSLAFKYGSLNVNYDYQAYKNRLLHIYPETKFDMQNVFKEDTFSFNKVNGEVHYKHQMGNPFNPSKEIVGAYCIIKNKRGEFIEIITMEDVRKMKSHSRNGATWDEWFDRMVLKSVIKRACKTHFDDITGEMDKLDNVDTNFEEEVPQKDVFEQIAEFEDETRLLSWAASNANLKFHADNDFREAVKKKSIELKQDNIEPQTQNENGGKG